MSPPICEAAAERDPHDTSSVVTENDGQDAIVQRGTPSGLNARWLFPGGPKEGPKFRTGTEEAESRPSYG